MGAPSEQSLTNPTRSDLQHWLSGHPASWAGGPPSPEHTVPVAGRWVKRTLDQRSGPNSGRAQVRDRKGRVLYQVRGN